MTDPREVTARDVLSKKRDGRPLSRSEIESFIRAFVKEEVADYQMSAFLMAAYIHTLSAEETASLTRAMAENGERLDLAGIAGKKVDKHSTGGVGDKVSIPLAPLVAACGVPVPMISGRGLGHTGGTLDKLESIPGFRTDLAAPEFIRVLSKVGYAMGGQTKDLAPADKRMYALRDVTATVESVPLIVSSILCKKIAEGTDALLLDVKHGRGAFMQEIEKARTLALEIARVGQVLGLPTIAFLTNMDRPLGRTIGNALEIEESIELLKGGGPPDLREITVTFGAAMLLLGNVAADFADGSKRIEGAIADGSGLECFRRVIEEQGGDARVVDDPGRLPRAKESLEFESPRDGYLSDLNPRGLAEAVLLLGGGRRKAEDSIDYAVGIRLHRAPGDPVSKGEPVLTLYGRDRDQLAEFRSRYVEPAVVIRDERPTPAPLIVSVIAGGRETSWDPKDPPNLA